MFEILNFHELINETIVLNILLSFSTFNVIHEKKNIFEPNVNLLMQSQRYKEYQNCAIDNQITAAVQSPKIVLSK